MNPIAHRPPFSASDGRDWKSGRWTSPGRYSVVPALGEGRFLGLSWSAPSLVARVLPEPPGRQTTHPQHSPVPPSHGFSIFSVPRLNSLSPSARSMQPPNDGRRPPFLHGQREGAQAGLVGDRRGGAVERGAWGRRYPCGRAGFNSGRRSVGSGPVSLYLLLRPRRG